MTTTMKSSSVISILALCMYYSLQAAKALGSQATEQRDSAQFRS